MYGIDTNMTSERTNTAFRSASAPLFSRRLPQHQQALDRCVVRLRETLAIDGLRNPKIGRADFSWTYCGASDWVMGFRAGQLWLAYQLSGDAAFANSAAARKAALNAILQTKAYQDHDLGFQFSLSCVAEWVMTGNMHARDMALRAADALRARFDPSGNYIQAWSPVSPTTPERSHFVSGRIIADSMENLPLLYWAWRETANADFKYVADAHAATVARHIVRPDGSSFHCFIFDPVTGQPLRGETHQGYSHTSCWSRGQAWLIHGFAQCYLYTGEAWFLDTARLLAAKAEQFLGDKKVPPWDYCLPAEVEAFRDSSAGAITAAGVYLIASACSDENEAERWRGLADRLMEGLLEQCDLTTHAEAHGFLDHGASYVHAGLTRAMLPYGDYYFMEALMRSLGHNQFFW
ncbi:hypothetical protein ACDA63_06200 [Uliginosibacterium sp. sgz301328]|uniref:hypothetical protein n=1 Tax=Uliginosibacterium sp. sgz301328 TaxID=3243764 RepID=UPI00359E6CD9